MKQSVYKKIYVVAPYKVATGGVELAHQLVDHLNKSGANAYIVYIADGAIVSTNSITPAYGKYNIQIAQSIEDKRENFLMLPEVSFDFMYSYENVQIGCWWMSVDNHYKQCHWTDALRFHTGLKTRLKHTRRCFMKGFKNTIADLTDKRRNIFHFYQSAYAQYHLYTIGASNVLPLKDYINNDFSLESGDNRVREDIVLYNPAKGFEYTQKIIKHNPDVTFVPLKGLSRSELVSLMCKAKLYIDFGGFPGKDRIPRECAINGMCVITGLHGASYFFEDVPIPQKYKIQDTEKNLQQISSLIENILSSFELHKGDFDYWRYRISLEESEFYNDIDSFFLTETIKL